MLRRLLALLLAAFLVAGAAPAFADDDPDEPTGTELEEVEDDEDGGDLGVGKLRNLGYLAVHFGVVLVETGDATQAADGGGVTAFDVEGFGLGDVFKLLVLAAANEASVAGIIGTQCTEQPDGSFECDWGELWHSVDYDGYRNLGQLISSMVSNRPDHARNDEPGPAGVEPENEKSGPPEHAQAGGRNRG